MNGETREVVMPAILPRRLNRDGVKHFVQEGGLTGA